MSQCFTVTLHSTRERVTVMFWPRRECFTVMLSRSMVIRMIVRDGDVRDIQRHCCVDVTCKAANVSTVRLVSTKIRTPLTVAANEECR